MEEGLLKRLHALADVIDGLAKKVQELDKQLASDTGAGFKNSSTWQDGLGQNPSCRGWTWAKSIRSCIRVFKALIYQAWCWN